MDHYRNNTKLYGSRIKAAVLLLLREGVDVYALAKAIAADPNNRKFYYEHPNAVAELKAIARSIGVDEVCRIIDNYYYGIKFGLHPDEVVSPAPLYAEPFQQTSTDIPKLPTASGIIRSVNGPAQLIQNRGFTLSARMVENKAVLFKTSISTGVEEVFEPTDENVASEPMLTVDERMLIHQINRVNNPSVSVATIWSEPRIFSKPDPDRVPDDLELMYPHQVRPLEPRFLMPDGSVSAVAETKIFRWFTLDANGVSTMWGSTFTPGSPVVQVEVFRTTAEDLIPTPIDLGKEE